MKLTGDDTPLARHVMIFLDGKICKRYIWAADEERGELVVWAENENGYLFPDASQIRLAKETITGVVEIVLSPNATKRAIQIYNKRRKAT